MEYMDGQVWEKYDYAVTIAPNTTVSAAVVLSQSQANLHWGRARSCRA